MGSSGGQALSQSSQAFTHIPTDSLFSHQSSRCLEARPGLSCSDLVRPLSPLRFGSLLYKVRNMDGLNCKFPGSSARLWFAPLGASMHSPTGLDRPEMAYSHLYPRSLGAKDQPPFSQLCTGSASTLLLMVNCSWGSSWELRSCGLESREQRLSCCGAGTFPECKGRGALGLFMSLPLGRAGSSSPSYRSGGREGVSCLFL